jgi:hypothetical protein
LFFAQHKSILRIFIYILVLCNAINAFAQDKNYRVNGSIKGTDGKFEDAYVAVNGNKHFVDSMGNFDVKVPFQEDNYLVFGRKGFVQQIYEFNTVVSKERIEESFYPKELNIILFEKVEGVDLSLMKEPVEIFTYSEDQYDFDSDEKYAAEMRSKIETLKAAIDEIKNQGKLSEEMIAKAKKDAEQQKLLQEQANKEAQERQKLEKERLALEAAKQKEEEEKLLAEEAAKRKAEREKKRQADLLKEQEELRLAKEMDDAELAEKQKQREYKQILEQEKKVKLAKEDV